MGSMELFGEEKGRNNMKCSAWVLAMFAAMLFSTALRADDKDGRKPEGKGDKGDRDKWEEMLKKFDKDGDGKLNDDEKANAKAFMEEHWDKEKKHGKSDKHDKDEKCDKEGGPDHAEILKRFDKNGDGKLDEDEKTAAKAFMEKHRGEKGDGGGPNPEMLKRFDTNGDGRLDEDEKMAAKAEMEKHHNGEMLKRFDKNHDGKLDDKERQAMEKMKDEMKKREGRKGDRENHDNRRGNNGVGNGEDPAPPGNPRQNDGAGTGRGNPGNRQR